MEPQILLLSLSVAVTLPIIVLRYVSHALRALLTDVCGNDTAADFWLRCIHVLAISGSVILVVAFVPTYDGVQWLQVIRRTLILTALGIFLAVALVARSIWSHAVKPAIQAARASQLPLASGEQK